MEAIISNIAHWKSCPIFCFIFPLNQKVIERGLFKCSKFSSLINLMNHHWSVLLDHIALQLDREGIKGREDGEKSAGEGAIIRGRRLIKGRPLFQGIRYMRLAWAPLAGILILRSRLIISIKQTIPPINYLYIPLPSNRALELVCNSHILPE